MTTTLEMTPEYFVSGDFDSRLRYLRQAAASPIAIVSGITWEIGVRASSAGSSWVAYRYNLEGITSIAFVSHTFNGTTTNQTVPTPVNVIQKVSF